MARRKSTTPEIVSGIKIDLNLITRGEFKSILSNFDGDILDDDDIGALVEKVVIEWPFDVPITAAGLDGLGLIDSRDVTDAIVEALGQLSKKK